MSRYDPEALTRCPAFAQLSPVLLAHLRGLDTWPAVTSYNAFAQLIEGASDVELPRFAERTPPQVKAAGGYEQLIATERVVPTRAGNWHDLFNALVWLHYPRFKWAANALQIAEMSAPDIDPRNKRSLVQSRAAQFDEGGMVLCVDDLALLEPIERLDWRSLFVAGRADFQTRIRPLVVGHALFESLLEPFVGITAKALPLLMPLLGAPAAQERAAIDRWLAGELPGALRANRFLPLPLLGIPGWHPQQDEAFYENPRYFRPRRAADGTALDPC